MTTVVVPQPVVQRTVTVVVPGPPGPRGPVPIFARQKFTVSNHGPYTLTYTPDFAFVQVLLDAYDIDETQYSITGKSLTLIGVTPSDFAALRVRYTTKDAIS